MTADLAGVRAVGLRVQICGDAHVQNLGTFAAADGELVFDLNDFDETLPGPWEWDLKRFAASAVLAGRESGAPETRCADAVASLVRSYRGSMRTFATLPFLELMRYKVRRRTRTGLVGDALAKAKRATPLQLLGKLAKRRRGSWELHDRAPILAHVSDRTARRVVRALGDYRHTLRADRRITLDAYRPVDVAFRVGGIGSVGVRNYIVLLFGRSPEDPLVLQVKQAFPPCGTGYLKLPSFPHQGQRIAEGQSLMQTGTDPLVGWTRIAGRDFVVRQLADHKARVETADLRGRSLDLFAEVAGEILSRAHARTGDAAAIAGYCGDSERLDKAIARFAVLYADQVEKDFSDFRAAVRKGKLGSAHAVRGVAGGLSQALSRISAS